MHKEFFQEQPRLTNEYDPILKSVLKSLLPGEVFSEIEGDVKKFGERSINEINGLAQDVLRQNPELIQFDPWGNRIDEIKVHPSWQKLHRVAAEEGLIALAYERKHEEYSRVHQFAKLFLYHPSSAFYSCPLAMTDGAARIIELLGDEKLKSTAYKNLTTRQGEQFWTSGQWMTEKEGGSDVSRTSTKASHVEGDQYDLTGIKWFSSATTAEMALALGRIEGSQEGSRGLSMFYIELRNREGRLNGIKVRRLKDKLGTRALPTAELELINCRARLVGEKNHGVKNIATMLNITRLHNSICSCAQMQRSLNLASNYARKRWAFGETIVDHPLHRRTLFEMHSETTLCTAMTMKLVSLFGREEVGKASEAESRILRLMLPVVKLYSAKKAVQIATECVEAFGGTGYVEDSGVPLMMRDAQVFPIWEGTTNILSLDVLRVLAKEPESFKDLLGFLSEFDADEEVDKSTLDTYRQHIANLGQFAQELLSKDKGVLQLNSRPLALAMGHLFGVFSLFRVHKSAEGPEKKTLANIIKQRVTRDFSAELCGLDESDLKKYDEFLQM